MEPELLEMLTEGERQLYRSAKDGWHFFPDTARELLHSLAEARQVLKVSFRISSNLRGQVQRAKAQVARLQQFIEAECDSHKTGEAAMTKQWRLENCLGCKAEAALAASEEEMCCRSHCGHPIGVHVHRFYGCTIEGCGCTSPVYPPEEEKP